MESDQEHKSNIHYNKSQVPTCFILLIFLILIVIADVIVFISPPAEADGKVPGSAVVSLRISSRHSTSEGQESTKSLTG